MLRKILKGYAVLLLAAFGGLYLAGPTTGPNTGFYSFEVEISTPVRARTQLYFDVGRDFNEAQSASKQILPSPGLVTVRLPLQYGLYRGLRFDVTDRDSPVTFSHPRILGLKGEVIRELNPADFEPNDQIAERRIEGAAVTVRPSPGADDPYLILRFNPRFDLRDNWLRRLAQRWPHMLIGAVLLWYLPGWVGRAWRRREAMVAWARARPQTALLAASLTGAVLATYPVVFLGKSFVSPNNGAALLYENAPSVPGYGDLAPPNLHGLDVGAMMWQHLPYSNVEARALLDDGELPLWNRYSSSGVTLLGQGQSMLGDPLHLPVILARGAAWAWDLKFILARALFAAALGLCVWHLTRDLAASLLVVLGGAFVGYYNYRFNHPAAFSAAYAPWILLAWILLAQADNGRRLWRALALWTIAAFTLTASGTVKEAYLLLLTLNLTGAMIWCLHPAPDRPTKVRHGLLIAATAVLQGLMTMPLWRTFFDALAGSYNLSQTNEVIQIQRAWLIGLFDDLFYREPQPQHYIYIPAANFLFLTGVFWALVQPLRLWRNPSARALLGGGLIAVLFAFKFVPPEWILAVPLLKNVNHFYNVFSLIAVIHFCVLGGWGFHAAREPLSRAGGWRWRVAAGLTGIVALLAVFFYDLAPTWTGGAGWRGWWSRIPEHAFFYLNLLLVFSCAALLCRIASRHLRKAAPFTAGTFALALALVAGLLYRNGLHAAPDIAWGEDFLTQPSVRADLFRPSPAVEFVRARQPEPMRVAGVGNVFFAGFSAVYGLEGLNGPDAIMNRHYHELAEAAGLVPKGDWHFTIDPDSLAGFRPLLNFYGVRYLLSLDSELDRRTDIVPEASLDLEVYRNDRAWPRAFFADRVVRYDKVGAFVELIRSGSAHPFAAVQSDDAEIPAGLPELPGPARIETARDYRITANTTSFTVEAPGPGVVVLQECWLSGDFKTTVNGAPAEAFRANHAFKGIAIPAAGSYHITVEYWPRHLTVSLLCAFGAAIVFLLILILLYRGSRLPPAPARQS